MTLTLTPEQEAIVEQSVRSGRFSTPEEALGVAIVNALSEPSRIAPEVIERLRKVRTKNLIELFRDRGFPPTDVEFPRDPAPMREVEFD